MKKTLIFLLLVTVVAGALCAWACGPFERGYLADQYFMFRAVEPRQEVSATYDFDGNCVAWQAATSDKNSLQDIREVVYRWPLDSIKALAEKNSYSGRNGFARWMVENKETEALSLLALAKRSEKVVKDIGTKWYYHVDGDVPSRELASIVAEAKAYSGKKYADRYALQVLRCLKALRDYKGCIAYWEKTELLFRPDVVRAMAADYAAGACLLSGQPEKAVEIYTEYLPEKLPEIKSDGMFQALALKAPDSPEVMAYLQREIREAERQADGSQEPANLQNYSLQYGREYADMVGKEIAAQQNRYRELYDMVMPVVRQGNGEQRARWNYAAAFLADKIGRHDEAVRYVDAALKEAPDSALHDSARILRLYIAAANAPQYDAAFESFLEGELRWLDGVMTSGLTPEVRIKYEESGRDSHICGWSIYYPADMMRKVLIGRVAPLCYRSGNPVRALQYLNYADNAIFKKVPVIRRTDYVYDENTETYKEVTDTVTWDKVRKSRKDVGDRYYDYGYDYACDYFVNLDSVGVDNIIALSEAMETPQSRFDHFLNDGSYIDPEYLYDIIGTQLILESRYDEAAEWLEKVSPDFELSRYVSRYFNRYPFSCKGKMDSDARYRLHFARKMAALQHRIDTEYDSDTRAELMLLYAAGLQNSVGQHAWALASNYWGDMISRSLYSWHKRKQIIAANEKAEALRRQALAMFTDPERAARAYAAVGELKTAVEMFPNSSTAAYLRKSCDHLSDYNFYPVVLPPAMEPRSW